MNIENLFKSKWPFDTYASASGAAATTGAATGTCTARVIGMPNGAAIPWLSEICCGAIAMCGAAYVNGDPHGLPMVYGDASGVPHGLHGDASPSDANGSGRMLALADMAKANITTAVVNCETNKFNIIREYRLSLHI